MSKIYLNQIIGVRKPSNANSNWLTDANLNIPIDVSNNSCQYQFSFKTNQKPKKRQVKHLESQKSEALQQIKHDQQRRLTCSLRNPDLPKSTGGLENYQSL